jgi:cold shock CspA family protein
MRRSGVLRSWNDERAFGFIAPTGGGREVFVHLSAFPRGSGTPVAGERLSFDLGEGRDGRPQALRVQREVLAAAARQVAISAQPTGARRTVPWLVVLIALLMGGGGYFYWANGSARSGERSSAMGTPAEVKPYASNASTFRCDGRRFCSQMTSCAEAKYFLQHCPNTEMDGDHDGVPCEQQWC